MPNAGDVSGHHLESVLLIGNAGSGKSTQFRTLPGRGFIYVFDPNALAAIQGCSNIDYEEFLPDMLDLNVQPLSKDAKTDKGKVKVKEPLAYYTWEQHFDNAYNTGFFDQYDWIGLDSFTTFSDSVMDRVLWLNGRLGKMPEQADWAAQMITVQNVFRTLASIGKLFVATAHEEWKQDELTKRVWCQPVMTGRLRIRIPLLFSNMFRCFGDEGRRFFQTTPDKAHDYVRTSMRGLAEDEDVTIEDWDSPQKFGLGRLLSGGRTLPQEKGSKSKAA